MKRLLLLLLLVTGIAGLTQAQTIVTPVGGIATVDASTCFTGPSNACTFKIILTAATSVVINNARGSQPLSIIFTENATGGWAVTWPANVPSNPILTTTANTSTLISLLFDSVSGTWLAVSSSSVIASGPSEGSNVITAGQLLTTYGAKFDVNTAAGDCTTTNSSNIVTCPSTDPSFLT